MEYDLIIIGAGPAGASAAIYACSRGVKTLVVESDAVGGTLGKVSVISHYAAITENESGKSFAARLERQMLEAGAEIAYETVLAVQLEGINKKITTDSNRYEAKSIIFANGTTPRKPDISFRGYAMNAARDGELYRGKNVYVIGGADGAVKEALYLSRIAQKVTIVHFEDSLAAIAEFTHRAESADNIEVMLGTRLTAVRGQEEIEALEFTDEKTGAVYVREDQGCGVFVYAGAVPNTGLCTALELKDGYIVTNERMETSAAGVYAAGDIRAKQVRQASTAVADGTVAAINAAAWVKTI